MIEHDTTEDLELHRLMKVLKEFAGEVMRHSARDMGCLMRSRDLSMPQVAALILLRRHGTASISEISEYLNLSLAATSQLVERLVVLGYVSRNEDPHDRRLKRVALTGDGMAMIEEVKQTRVEETVRRLRTMPVEIRESLLDALEQALGYMRSGDAPAGGAAH